MSCEANSKNFFAHTGASSEKSFQRQTPIGVQLTRAAAAAGVSEREGYSRWGICTLKLMFDERDRV